MPFDIRSVTDGHMWQLDLIARFDLLFSSSLSSEVVDKNLGRRNRKQELLQHRCSKKEHVRFPIITIMFVGSSVPL